MNYKKPIVLIVFLMCILTVQAQSDTSAKQTSPVKSWQIGKFKIPSFSMPKAHLPQVKMPKLTMPKMAMPKVHLPKVKMPQFTFHKNAKKAIIDSLKVTDTIVKKTNPSKLKFPTLRKEEFFVSSGINFSKQTISGMDYTLPFNYDVNKLNNDVYKPGYFVGARWEGVLNNKHLYNIEMGLHKVSSGTKYSTVTNLDPFIGEFVQHKADDQYFILNIGVNYKKLIAFKNLEKFKLYAIVGPSMDIRLSSQSIHNRVTNSYKKVMLRANLGLELDNNGYYTIFMHYKPSLSSFTKQPITTNLNSFELGMMLNVNDIF